MKANGYQIDILVQGYPGKADRHGGLGWSTVALLRGDGRAVLVDVGGFGTRRVVLAGLDRLGLRPDDVTDLVLTHSHYDHVINWVSFPSARIFIGAHELEWALSVPAGSGVVPELYVQELQRCDRLQLIGPEQEVLPGLVAHAAPGHTPGHLIFVLAGTDRDILFTGDAAKNRAEMLSREADATLDAEASRRSIDAIWSLWRGREGNVVIPGHDVPMALNDGRPTYLGERQAAITAWLDEGLDRPAQFNLAAR